MICPTVTWYQLGSQAEKSGGFCASAPLVTKGGEGGGMSHVVIRM